MKFALALILTLIGGLALSMAMVAQFSNHPEFTWIGGALGLICLGVVYAMYRQPPRKRRAPFKDDPS
jgi:uncharacterized membrane protein YdcZ (DUF606 family)